MEEQKEGLTVGEVCKVIFSQKWLALVIVVIITLAGTLGLYLGYNAVQTEYVRIFTVSFPDSGASGTVFPDNSPFDYRDIVSRENLVAAKGSNGEFDGIDIGKMYSERDITIARSANTIAGDQIETSYTINVKAKYFSNKNTASDFIDELVNMPVRYLLNLAADQQAYLLNYDDSDFYEDKISLLQKQIEFLIAGAEKLVAATGNNSSNIGLLNRLQLYNAEVGAAAGELHNNLYVHSVAEVCGEYSNLVKSLDASIQSKTREAEILYGKLGEGDAVQSLLRPSERVEQLAAEISELEARRSLYNEYLLKYPTGSEPPAAGSEEFAAKLTSLKAVIGAVTDEYETNLAEYYRVYSIVAYDGALISGGYINLALCLLISLAAGLAVAAAASFFAGIKKNRRAAKTGGDGRQTEPPAAVGGDSKNQ